MDGVQLYQEGGSIVWQLPAADATIESVLRLKLNSSADRQTDAERRATLEQAES